MLTATALTQNDWKNLQGVDERLARTINLAVKCTAKRSRVDFIVISGLRTEAEQRQLVEKGASQTMDSKHRTGEAVDLAAKLDGEVSWDPVLYFLLAEAMHYAARREDALLVWGACWRIMSPGFEPHVAVVDYKRQCKSEGREPFLDYGHFELIE